MNRKIYSKSDPLLPVTSPVLNTKYHVAWGTSNGVVGRCVSIDFVNYTVKMRSPKTGIMWIKPVKWSDLRHLRKEQQKIEAKK